MADSTYRDSQVTLRGGIKGMIAGALSVGILAALIAMVFAWMGWGAGGPGLHFMAGAAFGGLAGLFVGMLRARRRLGPQR